MKFLTASRFALTVGAVLLGSAIVDAQPRTQPQSAPARQGWQGCCGVSPWGYGGGMMGGHGGMMGGYGHGYGRGYGGMMGGSGPRHRIAMMGGIPAPYTNMTNPLPETRATVERGAAVYAANCASCHGPTGAGDGGAARTLSPRPANLAWLSEMPISRWDPFMYWTVAEGGMKFGTAMPSFKNSLSKDDTWAVIAYIQAHLPPGTARSQPPRR